MDSNNRQNRNAEHGFQFEIVRMTKEHIPQVAAIEAEVFSMPWSEQGFADTLEMDQALFCVAVVDTQVAGYCGIYLAADEGEITNVAVAPVFRRHRIAETLVKSVCLQAHTKGVQRIYLEVRKSNVSAICLYEKTGFSAVGSRKNFYQNPTEDALLMMYECADK